MAFCAIGGGLGARGGTEVHVRELARALAERPADELELLVLLGPRDELPVVPGRGLECVVVPEAARRWPGRLGSAAFLARGRPVGRDRLSRALDRLGAAAVHFPASQLLAPALCTPAILTLFDTQETRLPAMFTAFARFARRTVNAHALRQARRIVAPTRFTASCLRDDYGVAAERVDVVPVGVPDRFQPRPEAGEADMLARRHGLKAGHYLLYPAHPWPHKNHARLFRALALLRDRGSSGPLVCTGALTAPGLDLESLARANGLGPGDVRLPGFVPESDMPALYRGARAVVFPSLFEGFGMPVAEAMACGCPVAAAESSCLPEVAAGAALLFDPLGVESIAAAVLAVRDQARGAVLIEAGLRRAAELRWPVVLPRLLDVYRRVVAGGPS
jgi:glycosyltransferase involved in cell wall biosynthesis